MARSIVSSLIWVLVAGTGVAQTGLPIPINQRGRIETADAVKVWHTVAVAKP